MPPRKLSDWPLLATAVAILMVALGAALINLPIHEARVRPVGVAGTT